MSSENVESQIQEVTRQLDESPQLFESQPFDEDQTLTQMTNAENGDGNTDDDVNYEPPAQKRGVIESVGVVDVGSSGVTVSSSDLNKPFKKTEDLAIGTYDVRLFRVISSKFGRRIRGYFEQFNYNLPANFTALLNPYDLETLDYSSIQMKYMGKKADKYGTIMMEITGLPDLKETKRPDETMCAICSMRKKNSVLGPCGHGRICFTCAQGFKEKACPFCRKYVEYASKIYD